MDTHTPSPGAPGQAPADPFAAVRGMLKSQHRAALRMLREAIERCPDALWTDTTHLNPCWQVAYHALFFAHCYGSQSADAFRRWPGHVRDVQYEDGIPGDPDPASPLPLTAPPYAKETCLAYLAWWDERLDGEIDAMDLASDRSGFPWYPIPKLEHQLVSLRHVQHHAAQLATRLRTHAGIGIDWVGAVRPKPAAAPAGHVGDSGQAGQTHS